jgi:hypothetical protein
MFTGKSIVTGLNFHQPDIGSTRRGHSPRQGTCVHECCPALGSHSLIGKRNTPGSRRSLSGGHCLHDVGRRRESSKVILEVHPRNVSTLLQCVAGVVGDQT